MEMIDVLKKLQEIAETKPEVVKDAVENVTRTNPKVDEGKMKDYLHGEAEEMSVLKEQRYVSAVETRHLPPSGGASGLTLVLCLFLCSS